MAALDLSVMSVGEVMTKWPNTIGVFISLRLHCVGCPISNLHNAAEAARAHNVSQQTLYDAIKKVVEEED